jgi:hypothetical protein
VVKQPQAVLRRTLFLGLLCLTAFACKEPVSQFVFEGRIVDGQNGNPAAGTDAAILRIGIQEGELPAQEYEYPITEGDFDALLVFEAFSRPTRIRAAIEGPTTELLSAPPAFVPSLSSGLLRVVAAAPSSCERVTFDMLEAPRAYFGMVQSGTFALIAGGTTPTDEQVEFFDLLEWESRLFPDDFLVSDLGETRAAAIDEAEILVLPTNATPFIFNMFNATRRITPVVLHNGAGTRSALVSVPGIGAMVIGGELAGEAQSAVSLVEPEGNVTSLQLSEPRSGPAAAALGANVLVVGGNAEGTAEILLEGSMVGRPVNDVMDGVREGSLLVGDGESRALWIGGTDAADALRTDTLRFDGCPTSCSSSAGPEWTTARLHALQPPQSALIIGGDGSQLVDEVRWIGANVEISPLLQLDVPRAGAGGIVLESGAFIVAGGDDGASIREDFEFCVPATLEPL